MAVARPPGAMNRAPTRTAAAAGYVRMAGAIGCAARAIAPRLVRSWRTDRAGTRRIGSMVSQAESPVDQEFRVERDTMGEMRLPKDALWTASTQRAVENFPISGEPMPAELIHAVGLIKLAAAR